MREQDLAELKAMLPQRRLDDHVQLARGASARPSRWPRLRAGAQARIAAGREIERVWIDAPPLDAATAERVVPPPALPQTILLDRPNVIGIEAVNVPYRAPLLGTHYQPDNSWAQIYLEAPENDIAICWLTFYFIWDNPNGDVTIDVETSMSVIGYAEVVAYPHLLPSLVGETGTHAGADIYLAFAQFVNGVPEPDPPFQSAARQEPLFVQAESVSRLIHWFAGPDTKFSPNVDGAFALRYSGYPVRRGARVLFQAVLQAEVWPHDDGGGFVDLGHGKGLVGCPFVKLIVTPMTNK